MSLEAWGDEGADYGPEGYVTEELYEEQRGFLREAVRLLQDALPALHHERTALHAKITAWLADNTVNGEVP